MNDGCYNSIEFCERRFNVCLVLSNNHMSKNTDLPKYHYLRYNTQS